MGFVPISPPKLLLLSDLQFANSNGQTQSSTWSIIWPSLQLEIPGSRGFQDNKVASVFYFSGWFFLSLFYRYLFIFPSCKCWYVSRLTVPEATSLFSPHLSPPSYLTQCTGFKCPLAANDSHVVSPTRISAINSRPRNQVASLISPLQYLMGSSILTCPKLNP